MMDAIAASTSVTEVFRALFLFATRISPADGITFLPEAVDVPARPRERPDGRGWPDGLAGIANPRVEGGAA